MNYFWHSIIAILIVILFFYVQLIREKVAKMEAANSNLTEKITELRKLKHDYGSEISCLYGLYKLGEYKRLEKMLKDIIKRYQFIDGKLEINFLVSPMVNSLFAFILDKEIEIQDEGNYENIQLSEWELYKILSNIIKNAIEALEGVEAPLIKYKSYNSYKKLVIEIENIGEDIPRITEEDLNNIYNPGYSTKGSPEERGYGLSIVKELVDKVGGSIFIESKKNSTLFKLEIPRIE